MQGTETQLDFPIDTEIAGQAGQIRALWNLAIRPWHQKRRGIEPFGIKPTAQLRPWAGQIEKGLACPGHRRLATAEVEVDRIGNGLITLHDQARRPLEGNLHVGAADKGIAIEGRGAIEDRAPGQARHAEPAIEREPPPEAAIFEGCPHPGPATIELPNLHLHIPRLAKILRQNPEWPPKVGGFHRNGIGAARQDWHPPGWART